MQNSDYVVYAAAADDDNGWAHLLKEGYQMEILDEEGQVSGTEDCVEAETLKMAMEEGRAPNGVWIGGIKYKFIAKVRSGKTRFAGAKFERVS